MVQKEQLRVGNLIQDNSFPDIFSKVIEIRDDFIITNYCDALQYEGVHGIELTADILEKMGFVIENKKGNGGYYSVLSYCDFTWNSNHGWWYNGKQLKLQPVHLHQLQNLYWCLCGQELKVNLH